jgi:hypothetical protein
MKLGGSLGNVPQKRDPPNLIKLLWICSFNYHHQHPFLLLKVKGGIGINNKIQEIFKKQLESHPLGQGSEKARAPT